jgi:hypothetical protein
MARFEERAQNIVDMLIREQLRNEARGLVPPGERPSVDIKEALIIG